MEGPKQSLHRLRRYDSVRCRRESICFYWRLADRSTLRHPGSGGRGITARAESSGISDYSAPNFQVSLSRCVVQAFHHYRSWISEIITVYTLSNSRQSMTVACSYPHHYRSWISEIITVYTLSNSRQSMTVACSYPHHYRSWISEFIH